MAKREPLQIRISQYAEKGKTAVVSPPSDQQLTIHYAKLQNRSGSVVNMGVMRKLALSDWKLFQLIAANNPDATDVTAAIQAGSAVTLFSANNDGFLVQAKKMFNVIGVTVSVAETGSPVYTQTYFNGTSYATLTTLENHSYVSTGDKFQAFVSPLDWAQGTTAAVGGDTSGRFGARVVATTAPTTPVQITNLWLGQFFSFDSQIGNNQKTFQSWDEIRSFILEGGEGVMPYFSTANANNTIEVGYSIFG